MSEEADQPVEGDALLPESGVDAAAPAAATPELDGADLELDPIEGNQPEDDTEEVERDGKKYRIPKALKAELMMQADYTRKTQEAAETKRQAEAERAEARKAVEVQQAFVSEFATVTSLQQQVDEYEKITDWNALRLEHGDGPVNDAQFKYNQLRDQLGKAQQSLYGKIQQREQEQQRATAKLTEDRDAELQRDIPGWSPELRGKLEERALKAGFSKADVDTSDARSFKLLHRLTVLEARYAQDKKVTNVLAAQATEPARAVSGASAPASTGLSDTDTADAWMAKRNKQLQRKRG
jgi:hypothetical protein